MQYAQLNTDGTYSHQITTSGNVLWDANNFCPAAALFVDGKAEQFRVVELHETDAPEIDPITQSVMRDGGEFVDGRWQYRWRVDDLTPEQIAENATENTAAQAIWVRAQRNSLLTASDWTQIPDAPVDKAAWATYRQSLRDIPQQSGFPWTIVWPTQPE